MAGSNKISVTTADDGDSSLHSSDSVTVFQCHACLNIIGDSSCYVELLDDIGVLVLKWMDSIDSSKSLKISDSSSKDVIPGLQGSSKKVFCSKCSQQVGAVYAKGLPSSLSHLKDCLCLQIDAITSHKVASAPSVPVLSNQSLMSTLNYTIREIAKLKHVIMNFNERLAAIEHSLQEESV